MLLPNAGRAIIEPAKLRDYLLSPTHPLGRFKAAWFTSLGYSQDQWQRLERDLREQHLTLPAHPAPATTHGEKYLIRGPLRVPEGRIVPVVSVWIIRTNEEVPRFVTAYPDLST